MQKLTERAVSTNVEIKTLSGKRNLLDLFCWDKFYVFFSFIIVSQVHSKTATFDTNIEPMKKEILFLLVATMTLTQLSAQICQGNLGENIFTEGDFGTGATNILLPDPQIAPSYNYQPNPPPNDGYYSIANNTSSWGSFAGAVWINIGDNSNNADGYMMVINASYDPGLFYEQEVAGLCENTLYVFSADVINLFQAGQEAIKPNISFLLDGEIVYSTGDVAQDEQWYTYGFTFTTDPGQTSLTLSLQNNAPGGYGNDLAIDNISFRPCGPEALILPMEVANICEDGNPIELLATIVGDQYDNPSVQWQESFDGGQSWQNIPGATTLTFTFDNLIGGSYYYRYLLANGPANLDNPFCRIASNVKEVKVIPKFYNIADTLCQGLLYLQNDQQYSETGIYTDSFQNYLGCDSIVTLDLTIVPDSNIDAIFSLTDPSCNDLSDGNILLEEIINGYEPFTFVVNGEPSNTPIDLFNLNEEEQTYEIIDHFGCRYEAFLRLQLPAPFSIDLGEDQQLNLGESLQLAPFFSAPASSFIWSPSEIINCTEDCEKVTFTPTQSSFYTLTAADENGCYATDSVYVEIVSIREVYIPNIFSPNSDGVNDHFAIYANTPNVQVIENLQLFDRWGNLVFEQKGMLPNLSTEGWNGKTGTQNAPDGVYVYVAKIRFLDEAVILYTGDVTLVR